MKLFINFSELAGVTTATYRDPAGYSNDGVVGFVEDILSGCKDSSCEDFDGAKSALEDGALWGDLCVKYGDDRVQEVLESVHAAVVTAELDEG